MKKIFAIAIIVLLSISLMSCHSIGEKQRKMYDDNTLIVAEGDSYTYSSRLGEVTEEGADLNFSGFYGKETLYTLTSEEETEVEIEYNVTITGGLFKFCVIHPDDIITVVADIETEESLILTIKPGKSRVVIVGKNAKGLINLIITAEGVEILPVV